MDGLVEGRLIFGSKNNFSRFSLSGLRGPRIVFENFLARCFSRSDNDKTVSSEKWLDEDDGGIEDQVF